MNYEEVREYIRNSSEESEVFIGCDSHKKKTDKGVTAHYVTVVVVHNIIDGIGSGCKLFKRVDVLPDHGSMRERLMNEVAFSVSVATELTDVIGKRGFSIHLDINPDEREGSNVVIKEAIGYVRGMGFVPVVKPDSVAANAAADRYAVKLPG